MADRIIEATIFIIACYGPEVKQTMLAVQFAAWPRK